MNFPTAAYISIMMSCMLLASCSKQGNPDEKTMSPPPPTHSKMCKIVDLGEASDAVKKQLPNNQLISLQGISSPKTLVWQDTNTQQIYFATKIMGAQGKLFYMDKLKTGETPSIKSNFQGTLMLWKHLPINLLKSMKRQFKEQWGVEIDENKTYILKANEKPAGCK